MRGALGGGSFRAVRESLYRRSFTLYHPRSMVNRSLSVDSEFCQAVVSCGYLSFLQMFKATIRYRLGSSRSGGVIYWQIDHEGRLHDGKIMHYRPDGHRDKDRKPTWVSYLLEKRHPDPKGRHQSSHCLFGLHLLETEGREVKGERRPVAIVEAEKTAVILSEHYPQNIWMAAGGLGELQAFKLRPLRGHPVILFPDTDPDGTTFRRWSGIAREVMASDFWEGSPPIRVSPVLELHATPSQKAAKIDLVDFLFP